MKIRITFIAHLYATSRNMASTMTAGDNLGMSSALYIEEGALEDGQNESLLIQMGDYLISAEDDSDTEEADDAALFLATNDEADGFEFGSSVLMDAAPWNRGGRSRGNSVLTDNSGPIKEVEMRSRGYSWASNSGSNGRDRGYSWDIEVKGGNYVSPGGAVDANLSAVFDAKTLQKVTDDQAVVGPGVISPIDDPFMSPVLESGSADALEGLAPPSSTPPSAKHGLAESSSSSSKITTNSQMQLTPEPKPMRGGYAAVPIHAHDKEGKVGQYTYAQRRAIIEKFRNKKRNRIWKKQIKYVCRKKLAETRPRVKGRFVSRTEPKDEQGGDTGGSSVTDEPES